MNNIVGTRIKEKRKSLNITQEELAKRVGYSSRSAINKIEMGINDVSQAKLIEISKVLNCSIGYLLGDDIRITPKENIDNEKNLDIDPYGLNKKDVIEYFEKRNPDLVETYKHIVESENLKLLFDAAKDLEPEDLEPILAIVQNIRNSKNR